MGGTLWHAASRQDHERWRHYESCSSFFRQESTEKLVIHEYLYTIREGDLLVLPHRQRFEQIVQAEPVTTRCPKPSIRLDSLKYLLTLGN